MSFLLMAWTLLLFPVSAHAQTAKGNTRQELAKQRELAKQIEVILRSGDHGECIKKITFSIKGGLVSRQQCVHACFGTFNSVMVDVLDWGKSTIHADAKTSGLAIVEIPCHVGRCVISESGPFYGATPGSDVCGSGPDRNIEAQESMTLPVLAKRADELLALVTQIR
jgi:hypothetical protein